MPGLEFFFVTARRLWGRATNKSIELCDGQGSNASVSVGILSGKTGWTHVITFVGNYILSFVFSNFLIILRIAFKASSNYKHTRKYITGFWQRMWPSIFLTSVKNIFLRSSWHKDFSAICTFFQSCPYPYWFFCNRHIILCTRFYRDILALFSVFF